MCSVVFEVDHVTVKFDPPVSAVTNETICSIILFQAQVVLLTSQANKLFVVESIPSSSIMAHTHTHMHVHTSDKHTSSEWYVHLVT